VVPLRSLASARQCNQGSHWACLVFRLPLTSQFIIIIVVVVAAAAVVVVVIVVVVVVIIIIIIIIIIIYSSFALHGA
jgi:hypothetical protein